MYYGTPLARTTPSHVEYFCLMFGWQAALSELRMEDLHALKLQDEAARAVAAEFTDDNWRNVAKQTHRYRQRGARYILP